MLEALFTNPFVFLIWAFALISAITVHEFSHALVADHLGDPTPRLSGRLNLNPLSHLDPLGTVALLLIGFGWGKPVVFDPYNLRNPRRDAALISLAGPVSNILFALLLAVIYRFVPLSSIFSTILTALIGLNITLAVFNLVPVYPLDGEKILTGFLSPGLAQEYSQLMRQWGTVILIFMILPMGHTSAIASLITPVISWLTRLLL